MKVEEGNVGFSVYVVVPCDSWGIISYTHTIPFSKTKVEVRVNGLT